MKTFLKSILLASLLLLTFSCEESELTKQSLTAESDTKLLDFQKKSTMKISAINEMISKYAENSQAKLFKQNDYNDLSSWVSLDDLKAFLKKIELNTSLNSDKLGVRMYFGLLDQEYNNTYTCNEYVKGRSLILIPTMEENGINYDINYDRTLSTKITALVTSFCNRDDFNYEIDFIKTVIENYRDTYLKNTVYEISNLENGDTRSIWFSLDKLKEFIKSIESYYHLKNKNLNFEKTGIEFVYTTYPDSNKWYNKEKNFFSDKMFEYIPSNYEFRTTLVMIPTIKSKIKSESVLIQEGFILDNQFKITPFLSEKSNNNEELIAQNHGSLIPPITDTGESF